MSLWNILSQLSPFNLQKCSDLDETIAGSIVNMDSLLTSYYYLCRYDYVASMPNTQERINKIICTYLNDDNISWWKIRRYSGWLYNDTIELAINVWLNNKNNAFSMRGRWLSSIISSDSPNIPKVFEKLIGIYRYKKTKYNVSAIDNLFIRINNKYLDEVCEIISRSTPAIQVSFLSRSDLDEKYTIKGLRALSKLSRQKTIKTKVNIDMLRHLGPKSRLYALKQLFRCFEFRSNKPAYILSPFEKMPNREELEEFLFPCVLRHNDEVIALMKRFDCIIKQ